MRIAIVGPESSGKTVLSEYLAEATGADLVPEFAREYLGQRKGKTYDISDLLRIGKVQSKHMHRGKGDVCVCDTDMTTIVIWAKEKFETVPQELLDLEKAQSVDHYLLCKPNLPWEPDVLRENEADRERLFEVYKTRLTELEHPFEIIEGQGDERLSGAKALLIAWVKEVSV
jgi:nicotinamide riboside kinase